MNKVILKNINVLQTNHGSRIEYNFIVPKRLTNYIKEQSLFVEYPMNMNNLPLSILTIPFVGIMLTVSMLLNLEIHVPALDNNFYKSLNNLEKAYKSSYPKSDLKFNIHADNFDEFDITTKKTNSKCALFFTGGVDATSAMIGLLSQNPILINIWGGDIRLTDNTSHIELNNYLRSITEPLGLKYYFIKTNGREMFCENKLDYLLKNHVNKQFNHGWWATIAHTTTMISATIPFLINNNIPVIYFGSSYSNNAGTIDANNENILSAFGCNLYKITAIDNNLDRNEKINKIINWKRQQNIPLQLKVCWNRSDGQNCSACEKCYRTIFNIIANYEDPNTLGFNVNNNTLKEIKYFLETHYVNKPFWVSIKKSFLQNKLFWSDNKNISWILTIRFNSIKTIIPRLKRKFISHKTRK